MVGAGPMNDMMQSHDCMEKPELTQMAKKGTPCPRTSAVFTSLPVLQLCGEAGADPDGQEEHALFQYFSSVHTSDGAAAVWRSWG